MIRYLFLCAIFPVLLNCCSSKEGKGQVINVDSGTKLSSVLKTPIFSPFDVGKLLSDNPEDLYGDPDNILDLGDRCWGYEYIGTHGRVRLCHEDFQDESGWTSAYWIVLYPGKLYINDVIKPEFLSGIVSQEGESGLLIMAGSKEWTLILEMDSNAITRASYREGYPKTETPINHE